MAKNNEKILCYLRKTWLSLRIIGIVAAVLITVALAYARLNGRVENLEYIATKAEEKADIASAKAEIAAERVIRVEEGIEYLKKAVDRIEKKIDK